MSKIGKPRSTKGLAVFCSRLAEEKLARDILIMELTEIESSPTDFFVMCTCDSEAQVKAVVDLILNTCRELGIQKPRSEGLQGSYWVLLDFFDVVMHIMLKEARDYYKLEKLWGDASFFMLTTQGTAKSVPAKNIKLLQTN